MDSVLLVAGVVIRFSSQHQQRFAPLDNNKKLANNNGRRGRWGDGVQRRWGNGEDWGLRWR
ncbi:MAG TPA: hypothetical protein DCY88_17145 [Cyanobacteria bacterium UBA11372]|nr:hypothetical protein [Cyanobacteria bacterium UBA11372]